jgi:hypothetical protein
MFLTLQFPLQHMNSICNLAPRLQPRPAVGAGGAVAHADYARLRGVLANASSTMGVYEWTHQEIETLRVFVQRCVLR